jgi:putative endonuclease
MASHNDLGKKGESLAVTWLGQEGYELLFRNWRYAHYEVDIIAQKNNILHFIEVKARSNMQFGYPEESVNEKKLQNLMNAADAFLHQFPQWKRIQYNILSIIIKTDSLHEYFLIEDVFL